ncbi:MAG: hypothetical protein HN509_07265 [Halobacteriovoraceae bacterium]|nr:hypothetical protein [Halobacteriovoraceae bacterium]MBT5095472.1 hypothetical protein [Halobacteriovoraceae bacterium]
MKKIKKLIAAMVLIPGIVLAGTPVETLVPVEHIYSPKGFDSNDNAEIIIEGFLPNLCHKSPMTEYKVIGRKIEIKVKALKYDASNPYCPEVIVPFVESVNVGMLDKGLYDIVVNGKSIYQKGSSIFVNESISNSVDEHVYANVEYVEKFSGSREINLKGYNPSECFVIDEVQFVDNGKDTYSVLPKMKQVSDFCPMKMIPFSIKAEVPNKLIREKVLLHVRVMGGNSVNSIFSNPKL